MKKGLWIVIIIAIIVAVGLFNNEKKSAATQTSIKIAALLSLTGDAAAWGENAQKGIKLATEEVNKNGGINGKTVEIIYEDTAGDPKKAVSAYQSILSRGDVVAVIGPLNQTEDIAVDPLIKQSGMPTIVPGYIPPQNRTDFSNPLVVWMDAEIEAGRLAQYVFDQGIRKVGVIGTLDSWETTISEAFVKKFAALGGTITAKEIVQPDTADMKSTVTKVIASKPDAIYLGTYYQFINSVKSLSDQKYKGKIFGQEVDNYLVGETAGWSNGIQFIGPDYYSANFIQNYKNLNGAEPGIPSGQAYDSANILFSFIKQSEKREDIVALMKNFSNYEGVSGKLEITSDNRAILPTAIFEIKNGKVERLKEIK